MINVNVSNNQKGFALIVVLALLLLVTSVVMMSFGTSDTSTRIAANGLDKTRAFYAAEAGVIEAASYIKANRSFAGGALLNKTLPNGARFTVVWDSLKMADNSIRLVSTGDAVNPGAQTVIETKVQITASDLDNAVTVPNFGNLPQNDTILDKTAFRTKDGSTQILGKVWVGAPLAENLLQIRIQNANAARFAGVANLMIGGNEYNVKVNNPTGDGTANQFTVNVGGTNYTGMVTWDDPANPTTGTAAVTINGTTHSGVAKPGAINMTAGSAAYSGPTTASGKVGFLNQNQPPEPAPPLTAPNVAALGAQGAAAGGYTAPSVRWDLGNPGDVDRYLTINGVSTKVYDAATNTLNFDVIPGGILYLPTGIRFGNSGGQTVYYQGVGTIVAGTTNGDDEIRIEGSLIPAPGFAAASDLALVTSGEIEAEPHAGISSMTVMANAYAPGRKEGENSNEIEAFEMEDNVTWIGTVVTGAFEMEGDDDANGTTARLIYRRPLHPLPGLAYFGGVLSVAVKKGSWVEK